MTFFDIKMYLWHRFLYQKLRKLLIKTLGTMGAAERTKSRTKWRSFAGLNVMNAVGKCA
jgi:hypothetical protein